MRPKTSSNADTECNRRSQDFRCRGALGRGVILGFGISEGMGSTGALPRNFFSSFTWKWYVPVQFDVQCVYQRRLFYFLILHKLRIVKIDLCILHVRLCTFKDHYT